MVSPDSISNVFNSIGSGYGSTLLQWLGYFVISIVILFVMFVVYLWVQYRYKVTVLKVDGKKVSKGKWERARAINNKGIKQWRLLLRRKNIKPVPFEFIDKNRVILLQSATDVFTPVNENVEVKQSDGKEVKIKTLIPIDEDLKFWYQMQQQKIANDYIPDDATKKQMFILIGTIIFCVLLAAFTVWLSLKSTQGVVSAINNLQNAPVLREVAQGFVPG